MSVRLIPRIDIKGSNLVKGVHLEGLRVLGKPEFFARQYYEQGADELLYMDIVASLYGRNSLLETISKISKEVFIPLTVGGGLRSLEDIKDALRAGADKVAINTAAIQNPDLIRQAVRKFGSSTIVVSIEAKKKGEGQYEAYTDNGRERSGLDAYQWALQATELGAGEIMLTSIDHEGTGKGFDIEFTKLVSEAIPIPLIASGGAGNIQHILEVAETGKANAICIASLLHYNLIEESGEETFSSIKTPSSIGKATLPQIKSALRQKGIHVRF